MPDVRVNDVPMSTEQAFARLADTVAAQDGDFVAFGVQGKGDLAIGVLPGIATLNHVPEDLMPPYRISRGPAGFSDLHVAAFYFSGEESEQPGWSLLPVDTAKQAVEWFLQTGELAAFVDWVDN